MMRCRAAAAAFAVPRPEEVPMHRSGSLLQPPEVISKYFANTIDRS